MKNYVREMSKAMKRISGSASYAANGLILTNLIEDQIPLAHRLDSCVFSRNGFDFSLTFITELKVEERGYFVLDGVSAWFAESVREESAVLRKCPSLMHAMYGYRTYLWSAEVLLHNPWLLSSFDYKDTETNTSLVQSVMKTKVRLETQIKEYLSDQFIPVGLWGVDYLFRAKSPSKAQSLLEFGDFRLTPREEYFRGVTWT